MSIDSGELERNRGRVESALKALLDETRDFVQQAIEENGNGQLYIDRLDPNDRSQIRDVSGISGISDPAAFIALLLTAWEGVFANTGLPNNVNFSLVDKIRHLRNDHAHNSPKLADAEYVDSGLSAVEALRRAFTLAARRRPAAPAPPEATPQTAKPRQQEPSMPYTADISRTNPACFLFLIDQSGSMNGLLAGQADQHKKDQAALALNRVLDEISLRCSQGMDIRDYFQIGIIGYKTDITGKAVISSLLNGTTLQQPFLPISRVVELAEIEERQAKESDGAGGLVEVTRQFPVWVRSAGEYGTPMCQTLDLASRALQNWVVQYPDSFPPIVINISDGIPTDGDPTTFAQQITNLQTSDGNALIFNIHLSGINAIPCQYPGSVSEVPQGDEYAPMMFRMSSVLPESSRQQAASLGLPVNENSRGYVFNADMAALVQFLDIGTRAASNLH